jgi:hypothetical protein
MFRWCAALIFLVACCGTPLQEPQARETVFTAHLASTKANGEWLVRLESGHTLSLANTQAFIIEPSPGTRLYIKGILQAPGMIFVESISVLP